MNKIVCFKKGTSIELFDGSLKPIEEIQLKDQLKTYILGSNLTCHTQVDCIAHSIHYITAKIEFLNGSKLICTLDHPIFVKSKKWSSINPQQTLEAYKFNVGKLEVGDVVFRRQQGILSEDLVSNISFINQETVMYSISSPEFNNYFANGVLVHDCHLASINLRNHKLEFERV